MPGQEKRIMDAFQNLESARKECRSAPSSCPSKEAAIQEDEATASAKAAAPSSCPSKEAAIQEDEATASAKAATITIDESEDSAPMAEESTTSDEGSDQIPYDDDTSLSDLYEFQSEDENESTVVLFSDPEEEDKSQEKSASQPTRRTLLLGPMRQSRLSWTQPNPRKTAGKKRKPFSKQEEKEITDRYSLDNSKPPSASVFKPLPSSCFQANRTASDCRDKWRNLKAKAKE